MLKLELIADVNRVITHKSVNGVMKCVAKGCCVDSRKFRVYGFVNISLEEQYNRIGLIPAVRFFYNIESGDIWMSNPNVDYNKIENKYLKDIVKTIQRSNRITRVNILANEKGLPEASKFAEMVEEVKNDINDIQFTLNNDSFDFAVIDMLFQFTHCYQTVKNRLEGDNNNKTGNYGYNKERNCLYRKPNKQRTFKRGKFNE